MGAIDDILSSPSESESESESENESDKENEQPFQGGVNEIVFTEEQVLEWMKENIPSAYVLLMVNRALHKGGELESLIINHIFPEGLADPEDAEGLRLMAHATYMNCYVRAVQTMFKFTVSADDDE